MKLKREYTSLRNPNQLAWSHISPTQASDSGSSKNTATAPLLNPFTAAQVGSRLTNAAESCYAPVEGEALIVSDALGKARLFVMGCRDLIIAVDHKP